jgi:hypothetical protein
LTGSLLAAVHLFYVIFNKTKQLTNLVPIIVIISLSLSLSLCLIAVVTNSGFHCWRSDNAVALDTDFWPNTQASEIVGVIGICWCGWAL